MVSDIGYMSNSHKIGALYCTASPQPLVLHKQKCTRGVGGGGGGGLKSRLHKERPGFGFGKIF